MLPVASEWNPSVANACLAGKIGDSREKERRNGARAHEAQAGRGHRGREASSPGCDWAGARTRVRAHRLTSLLRPGETRPGREKYRRNGGTYP